MLHFEMGRNPTKPKNTGVMNRWKYIAITITSFQPQLIILPDENGDIEINPDYIIDK
jgi:hypothetical protein